MGYEKYRLIKFVFHDGRSGFLIEDITQNRPINILDVWELLRLHKLKNVSQLIERENGHVLAYSGVLCFEDNFSGMLFVNYLNDYHTTSNFNKTLRIIKLA